MHPLTRQVNQSVSALGEEKLIAEIRRWLGTASPRRPFGIGDDCAVLPASPGRQLITVDPVIFGKHFDASVAPRSVGAKLLKRNLSDLAAMGGKPTAAVLSLMLDRHVRLAWLEQFYRGLAACARRYEVPIVGGDIAQADGVVGASLTLLGAATGRRVLTRTGAKTGDFIYVTGLLGGSRWSGHHYKFSPRLGEGAWLAQQPTVLSMMDVSDGLAKDLHALTPANAEPALVDAAVPRRPGTSLKGALTDGEDYELVFTFAQRADQQSFQARWAKAFPRTRLSCIGKFVPRGELPPGATKLARYRGYEHLGQQGSR